MSENEMEGQDGVVDGGLEAERVRFENERMTRRAALRKFGFMAGLAALATVSVDDLARVASKKLQENEMTKGIGNTLAQEFRAAGVALADPILDNPYGAYNLSWGSDCLGEPDCDDCCDRKYNDCIAAHTYAGTCRTRQTACSQRCAKGF